MKINLWIFLFSTFFLFSCSALKKSVRPVGSSSVKTSDSRASESGYIRSTVVIKKDVAPVEINTRDVKPSKITDYALQQLGVPYKYGSIDKRKGFDCSGFITYVFSHFNIMVPRITYQFTNAGVDIPIEFSKPGDIILFTGSDARSGIVGHMGIITKNDRGNIEFVHASSSRGVVVSNMNSYFIPRYVRVNRIFIPSIRRK